MDRAIVGSVAGCALAQWGYDMFGYDCAARVVPFKKRPGFRMGVTCRDSGLRYFIEPVLIPGQSGPQRFDKGDRSPFSFLVAKASVRKQEVRSDTRERRLKRNGEYVTSGRKAQTPSAKRGPRKWASV